MHKRVRERDIKERERGRRNSESERKRGGLGERVRGLERGSVRKREIGR